MKVDIPNRPAITIASNLLQVIGLLLGATIIIFGYLYRNTIVGYGEESIWFTLFTVLAGGLVWISFAIWGELLAVFKSMEQVQIEILNHLEDAEQD